MFNCFLFVFDLFKLLFILFRITLWPICCPLSHWVFRAVEDVEFDCIIPDHCLFIYFPEYKSVSTSNSPSSPATHTAMTYGIGNKTCRETGKLTCILESYIHSYQTWFKSIKGFAKTDTVKILHKKIQSLWPWPHCHVLGWGLRKILDKAVSSRHKWIKSVEGLAKKLKL